MDPETPEADAVEQSLQAEDNVDDDDPEVSSARDADPADVADQQRSVPEDDSYDRG